MTVVWAVDRLRSAIISSRSPEAELPSQAQHNQPRIETSLEQLIHSQVPVHHTAFGLKIVWGIQLMFNVRTLVVNDDFTCDRASPSAGHAGRFAERLVHPQVADVLTTRRLHSGKYPMRLEKTSCVPRHLRAPH